MFLLLGAMFCTSCAVQQSPLRAGFEAAAETAIKSEIACGNEYVSAVDDGISDAQSVALTLAIRCSPQYHQTTRAMGLANLDNDTQRRVFHERRNRTDAKIEAFLPTVMRYRVSLKKK